MQAQGVRKVARKWVQEALCQRERYFCEAHGGPVLSCIEGLGSIVSTDMTFLVQFADGFFRLP